MDRKITVMGAALPAKELDEKPAPIYSRTGIIEFIPRQTLRGWIDRTRRPPVLSIRIRAFSDETKKALLTDWHDAKISIEFETVGLPGKFRQDIPVHLTSADQNGDFHVDEDLLVI